MAQYMLSVWHDEEYDLDFSGEDAQRLLAQVGEFNEALEAEGALVFACGLLPGATAKVMRPNEGRVVVTSGLYAVSGEHIGGFWIIEASDVAAAEDWGRRASLAREGPVEVRGVQSG